MLAHLNSLYFLHAARCFLADISCIFFVLLPLMCSVLRHSQFCCWCKLKFAPKFPHENLPNATDMQNTYMYRNVQCTCGVHTVHHDEFLLREAFIVVEGTFRSIFFPIAPIPFSTWHACTPAASIFLWQHIRVHLLVYVVVLVAARQIFDCTLSQNCKMIFFLCCSVWFQSVTTQTQKQTTATLRCGCGIRALRRPSIKATEWGRDRERKKMDVKLLSLLLSFDGCCTTPCHTNAGISNHQSSNSNWSAL